MCAAIGYLFFGLLWIYGSDHLTIALTTDPRLIAMVETVKGMAFVVVTSFFFYVILKSRLAAMRAALAGHYEHVIKYANDTFVLTDAKAPNRIVEINDAALFAYGYTKNEMIGMPAWDLRAEKTPPAIARDFVRYASQGSGVLYETMHRRKDGSIFPVEVSGRVVEIGGRKYFQTFIRDISERKRNEAALLESKQRLLTLLDNLPDTAWMKSHEGRYLAANKAFADFLHIDITQIPGKTSHDLFPAEMAELFDENERQAVAANKATSLELYFDSASGGRWFDTVVLPIREENGVGTVGIAHDITERKTIEHERQHRAQELETLLDNIPDPIVRFDRYAKSTYANHASLELAPRLRADLSGGVSLGDSGLPAAVVERVNVAIKAVFVGKGQQRFELEIDCIGERVSLDCLMQPEFDVSGHVISALCIGRDLTVYKKLDAERLEHETQLQDMLVETIHAMALTVEKRDPYTAGHQSRVADLAVAIGQELGLSEHQIKGLRLGGIIHDIGKIYIPSEILNRPGRITEQEMALIRTHPEVGHDIVKDIQFIWPVKDIVLHHHERFDGTGYPHGLRGDEISLEARIVAVADVVEAISSRRPYRPALGVERGLDEIRNGRGTHYDPTVVDACLALFAENRFVLKFE